MCDSEPLLLEQSDVLIGRIPDAQSVICMVDEVYLSVMGQSVSLEAMMAEQWLLEPFCLQCLGIQQGWFPIPFLHTSLHCALE